MSDDKMNIDQENELRLQEESGISDQDRYGGGHASVLQVDHGDAVDAQGGHEEAHLAAVALEV